MVDIIEFRTDRSGVSPVIGVILMVAVTVIIAAVIGSAALGLGESVSDTPPQAQFSAELETVEEKDYKDVPRSFDAIVISHNGGEEVDPRNIKVEVDGEPAYAYRDVPLLYPTDEASDRPQPIHPFDEQNPDLVDSGTMISSGDETEVLFATPVFEEIGVDFSKENDQASYRFSGDDVLHDSWGGDAPRPEFQEPEAFDSGNNNVEASNDDLHLFEEGSTVKVIWEDGSTSQTLLEEEV